MGTEIGPYAQAAWAYRQLGWVGVLPLPTAAKGPPPGGYTGWAGVDPSGPDIQAWVDGREGAGNIGLRLPLGVYGLDVDAYGAKGGAAALERLVADLGPLPPTWVVSSRDDGVSGIRLFRAHPAPGRVWVDEPAGHGAGIEAVHFGHRYAVVAPSIHPDTGRAYAWRHPLYPGGDVAPAVTDLPELPPAWVEALTRPGEIRAGSVAGHDEAVRTVTGWREGEACPRVGALVARALERLAAGAAGAALHPVVTADLWELVCLGHEGHAGVRQGLAQHYAGMLSAREARDGARGRAAAEGEWWRLVRGAVGKLDPLTARDNCDCDLLSGVGVTFTLDGLGLPPAAPAAPGEPAAVAPGGEPAVERDLADRLIERMIGPAELRDRPAPRWLVDGLLTLDSASWLIAAPASYKSFVALDWAAHVAGGKPWMGRAVTAGTVLYVVAEGIGGMGPRIRAWERQNGPMPDALRFLPMPIQASRPDHWAALVEACRRLQPVLVVLDTQARITVGIDENDNSAMGVFVESIDQLRRASGSCVLVVHHLGRNGTHARGASAIDGAQDTELRLTRPADLRVSLRIDKSKNAADDVEIEMEMLRVDLGDGESSLVVTAPFSVARPLPDHIANLATNQATLLGVMVDVFPAMGATKAELWSEIKKRPAPGGKPLPESSFRRAWDALCDRAIFIPVPGLNGRFRYEPSESAEL